MPSRPPSSSTRSAQPITNAATDQAEAKASNKIEQPKKRRRIRPETRTQMLERLTNPQITLHEASVILRKCPATVRAYCDSGQLPHQRTSGGQRRFFLRDVLTFLRDQEAEKRKPHYHR